MTDRRLAARRRRHRKRAAAHIAHLRCEGMTSAQIGVLAGLTRQRIDQIGASALRHMREACPSMGIVPEDCG